MMQLGGPSSASRQFWIMRQREGKTLAAIGRWQLVRRRNQFRRRHWLSGRLASIVQMNMTDPKRRMACHRSLLTELAAIYFPFCCGRNISACYGQLKMTPLPGHLNGSTPTPRRADGEDLSCFIGSRHKVQFHSTACASSLSSTLDLSALFKEMAVE